MNPSIEVQITARLDKLDAALNVAQSKVQASAATMGKAGEAGGSQFVDNLVSKMAKGLAMGAITQVLGKGILTALEGIHAGKGGMEIGVEIGKSVVEGAKSVPIVGPIVAILDELINGMDRLADAAHDKAASISVAFMEAFAAAATSSEQATKRMVQATEDAAAAGDPSKVAELKASRTIKAADEAVENTRKEKEKLLQQAELEAAATVKAARADYAAKQEDRTKRGAMIGVVDIVATAAGFGSGGDNKENEAQLARQVEDAASTLQARKEAIERIGVEVVDAANASKLQSDKTLAQDREKIAKETADNEKKVAVDAQKAIEDAQKKAKDAAETAEKERVAAMKQLKKEEFDAAMQAQQDIIDAESAAQKQIDKVGRVDQMAGQAAQGMISSGQTALGQFNFAQEGAGGQAMALAQKQVASLEKIEAATAQQVQLMKESKGFA